MQPEIKTRDEIKVVYVRKVGSYETSAKEAWDALCEFAAEKNLFVEGAEYIGISHDDPRLVPIEKLRYDACISITGDIEISGDVEIQTIAGGPYAIFLHKGPYENLMQTYGMIFEQWLPASGKQLREVPCFEKYINDPTETAPEDLLTEVCLPLAE